MGRRREFAGALSIALGATLLVARRYAGAHSLGLDLALVATVAILVPLLGEKRAGLDLVLPPLFVAIAAGLGGAVARAMTSRTAFEWLGGSPPSVRAAVGTCAFLGDPKSLEVVAYWTAVAFVAAVGLLVRVSLRREPASPAVEEPADRPRVVVVVLLAVVPFLALFPDLEAAVARAGSGHRWDWDEANLLAWTCFDRRGLLPLRDYWFPYGGFQHQLSPLPANLLASHIHITLVAFGILSSVYALTRWNRAITAVTAAGLVYASAAGWIWLDRYGLSVGSVLGVIAVRGLRPGSVRAHALLGLALAGVFYYEPAQLAYAALPLALFFILDDLPRARARGLVRHAVRPLGALLATFALGVGAYVALLAARGQLAGFVELYRDGAANAARASEGSGVVGWFQLRPDLASLALVLALACVAYGIQSRGPGPRRLVGAAVLPLGLLATVLFSKNLVRRFPVNQCACASLAAAWFAGLHWTRSWTAGQRALLGLLVVRLGLELGSGRMRAYEPVPAGPLELIARGPERMARGLVTLARGGDAEAVRAVFAPETIARAEGREIIDVVSSFRGQKQIFVLGDELFLYLVTEQRPPRYQTLYSGASLRAQRETIDWIVDRAPEVVVWNSHAPAFDLERTWPMSFLVPVPLLFEHVIRHYVPWREVAGYSLLRPREPGTPVAWKFWWEHLGSRLNLGAVPSLSTAARLPLAATPPWRELLAVTVRGGSRGQRRVAFEVDGQACEVELDTAPSRTTYHVDLSRLWFWSVARAEGLEPRLALVQDPELQLSIEKHVASDDVLY